MRFYSFQSLVWGALIAKVAAEPASNQPRPTEPVLAISPPAQMATPSPVRSTALRGAATPALRPIIRPPPGYYPPPPPPGFYPPPPPPPGLIPSALPGGFIPAPRAGGYLIPPPPPRPSGCEPGDAVENNPGKNVNTNNGVTKEDSSVNKSKQINVSVPGTGKATSASPADAKVPAQADKKISEAKKIEQKPVESGKPAVGKAEDVKIDKNALKNVAVDDASRKLPYGAQTGASQSGQRFFPGGVFPIGNTDIVFPDIVINNANDINNANENQNQVAAANENSNYNPSSLSNQGSAQAQNFHEFSENSNFNFNEFNFYGEEKVVEVPVTRVVEVVRTITPCVSCPPRTELVPVTRVVQSLQTIVQQQQLPGQTVTVQEHMEVPVTVQVVKMLPAQTIIQKESVVVENQATVTIPPQTIIKQERLTVENQVFVTRPGKQIVKEVYVSEQIKVPVTVEEKIYVTEAVKVTKLVSVPGVATPVPTTITEQVVVPAQVVTKKIPGVATPVVETILQAPATVCKEIVVTKPAQVVTLPGAVVVQACKTMTLPAQVITQAPRVITQELPSQAQTITLPGEVITGQACPNCPVQVVTLPGEVMVQKQVATETPVVTRPSCGDTAHPCGDIVQIGDSQVQGPPLASSFLFPTGTPYAPGPIPQNVAPAPKAPGPVAEPPYYPNRTAAAKPEVAKVPLSPEIPRVSPPQVPAPQEAPATMDSPAAEAPEESPVAMNPPATKAPAPEEAPVAMNPPATEAPAPKEAPVAMNPPATEAPAPEEPAANHTAAEAAPVAPESHGAGETVAFEGSASSGSRVALGAIVVGLASAVFLI